MNTLSVSLCPIEIPVSPLPVSTFPSNRPCLTRQHRNSPIWSLSVEVQFLIVGVPLPLPGWSPRWVLPVQVQPSTTTSWLC